jgi:hypothetical protein
MTTEELLKPRYKVTGTYPGSPFEIGDVLVKAIDSGKLFWSRLKTGQWANSVKDIEKYPHIFTEMHWSERRKFEDLPRYLSFLPDGHGSLQAIYKVVVYGRNFDQWLWTGESYVHKRESLIGYDPATEEQYNEYINRKPS